MTSRYGVTPSLAHVEIIAGQGTSAPVILLQVTNTGSRTDTFDLTVTGLPTGSSPVFSPYGIDRLRDRAARREQLHRLSADADVHVRDSRRARFPSRCRPPRRTTSTVRDQLGQPGPSRRLPPEYRCPSSPSSSSNSPGARFQAYGDQHREHHRYVQPLPCRPRRDCGHLGSSSVQLLPGASQIVTITTTSATSPRREAWNWTSSQPPRPIPPSRLRLD